MTRLSTQNRLIVLGVFMVAAIIGGTALIMRMERDSEIAASQVAVSRVNIGMSRQTAHLLAPADEALRHLQTALAPGVALPSPAVFGLLSQQFARLSAVDTLFVADANGQVVNASRGWPEAAISVSGQDYFRHFKAGDDPGLFAGNPARDPVSGALDVPLARRIAGAQGEFAGVAVAELSLADLAAFYQLAMPPSRVVYLVRRDGIVLLGEPAPASDTGRRIPPDSPWYATVARGGGAYDGPAFFDPAPVIAVARPLPNLPFILVATGTEADALADWQSQINWIILGGMLAVAGAVGILQLFARQFERIETSKRRLAAKNAELDFMHRQLQVTLANLSQGVCFFDHNDRLLVFNARYCELIGLPREAVRAGMTVAEIAKLRFAAGSASDMTLEEYLGNLARLIRDAKPADEIVELKNGRVISKHFEPLPGQGWVLTMEDISERRAAEMKISYLAHHDLLTGLANRVLFRDRLSQALAEAASGKGFAMLCLDLDRFKAVNDLHGHPVGDGLLCAVADRLRAVVRASDIIARLGGDEFVILQLGVSDKAESAALARRIVQVIKEPYEINGHLVGVGVSIGIAMAPGQRVNPERLFQHADQALYRSKQRGRGTWEMYEPEMETADSDC